MGGWVGGGVNNVPLDIHLHDDLFLLIASTVPRHTDALRLIESLIHPLIHSFIHFFSRASRVYSRGSHVHIRVLRAQPRSILRVYNRGKFRVYSRGSARPGICIHAYIHAYIHTLHYITIHYITLHTSITSNSSTYIPCHNIIHYLNYTYKHTYIHACMHAYIRSHFGSRP